MRTAACRHALPGGSRWLGIVEFGRMSVWLRTALIRSDVGFSVSLCCSWWR